MRQVLSLLVVLALVGSACGGSTTVVDSASANSTSGGSETAPTFAREPDFDAAAPSAQQLVESLGDDATAIQALLIAGENGYTREQVLAAVDSLGLQEDGSVTGEDPAGSPLGRVELPAKAGQRASNRKPVKRPAQYAAAFFQQADGKLLIEELRAAADDAYEGYDRTSLVGIAGTAFIVSLLRAGATPEQVIDSLVLGLYFWEDESGCFTQSFPLSLPPVERQCDEPRPASSADQDNEPEPEDPVVPAAEPTDGAATYEGDLSDLGLLDSSLVVSISDDGVVTGALSGIEQLENYLASINPVCGLFSDSEEERDEDCEDSVVECPATVVWSSDLTGLVFEGEPPDSGMVSGTINLIWDTTPDGCGEPMTETNPVEIIATVAPASAQITVPFTLDLTRVPNSG